MLSGTQRHWRLWLQGLPLHAEVEPGPAASGLALHDDLGQDVKIELRRNFSDGLCTPTLQLPNEVFNSKAAITEESAAAAAAAAASPSQAQHKQDMHDRNVCVEDGSLPGTPKLVSATPREKHCAFADKARRHVRFATPDHDATAHLRYSSKCGKSASITHKVTAAGDAFGARSYHQQQQQVKDEPPSTSPLQLQMLVQQLQAALHQKAVEHKHLQDRMRQLEETTDQMAVELGKARDAAEQVGQHGAAAHTCCT